MSREMAHKVIVPQKKNMSRSFLNSGTLIVNLTFIDAEDYAASGKWEKILICISNFQVLHTFQWRVLDE